MSKYMSKYEFNHFGNIVEKPLTEMNHYPDLKIWTSDFSKNEFRIERVCFDDGSDYHPLIKEKAHVCFEVEDIYDAVKGRKILKEPTKFGDVTFSFIEENGVPIEFFELSK